MTSHSTNTSDNYGFGEWSEEVLKQLQHLNQNYSVLKSNYDSLLEKYNLLDKLLTGTGSPEKGLVMRVALMEQAEKRRDFWVKTTVGASITALLAVVGEHLSKVWK